VENGKYIIGDVIITPAVARITLALLKTAVAEETFRLPRSSVARLWTAERGTKFPGEIANKAYVKLDRIGAITRTPETITIADVDKLWAIVQEFDTTGRYSTP
jgi:hypothetical protein